MSDEHLDIVLEHIQSDRHFAEAVAADGRESGLPYLSRTLNDYLARHNPPLRLTQGEIDSAVRRAVRVTQPAATPAPAQRPPTPAQHPPAQQQRQPAASPSRPSCTESWRALDTAHRQVGWHALATGVDVVRTVVAAGDVGTAAPGPMRDMARRNIWLENGVGLVIDAGQFIEHYFGVRNANRALEECLRSRNQEQEADRLRRENEELHREVRRLQERIDALTAGH